MSTSFTELVTWSVSRWCTCRILERFREARKIFSQDLEM